MKNIKYIFSVTMLLAVGFLFVACQGEEPDLFEKSAAERLNEVSKTYTDVLAESEAGWIMEYYPTNTNSDPTGLGYLMLVDFDKDGSVKIGMKNDLTEGAYEEASSLWEVITDNGPVLSFSSYNDILHYFSDPAIYDQGLGLEGDYEFVMVQVPEDHQTIMLKGKKRSTYVRLTRLPAGTDFEEYLTDVYTFQNQKFASNAPNFDYLTLDGKQYELAEMSTTLPNLYLYGTDAIANEYRIPYLITKINGQYHLRFRTAPFIVEEAEASPQEFVYDEAQDKFLCLEDEVSVIEGDVPARFFDQTLDGEGTTIWKFDRNSNKSEAAQAIVDQVYADFQTISYTFTGGAIIKATVKEGDANVVKNYLRLTCTYLQRQGNRYIQQSTNYQYELNRTVSGDDVTFSYAGCNAAAQTVYDRFDGVKDLVNTFGNQAFKAEATGSRFNLNSITLTAASNSNLWYALSL